MSVKGFWCWWLSMTYNRGMVLLGTVKNQRAQLEDKNYQKAAGKTVHHVCVHTDLWNPLAGPGSRTVSTDTTETDNSGKL